MTTGLDVTFHDPHRPAPEGWDEWVAKEAAGPVWDWSVVSAAARDLRGSLVATVRDGGRVRGLLSGRFNGPRVGRTHHPVAGLVDVDCFTTSAVPGFVLGESGPDLEVEFFHAVRRALGAAYGPRCRAVSFRNISAARIPVFTSGPSVIREGQPIAVLRHGFTDYEEYLASLGRSRRKNLRSIERQVAADADLVIEFSAYGDPATLALEEVAALHDEVADRHRVRWIPARPFRPRMAAAALAHPDIHRLTYRDRSGRLLAFTQLWDHPTSPVGGAWGMVGLDRGGRRGLYFHTMGRLVRWCIDQGRPELLVGKGTEEEKRSLGFGFDRQWTVVSPLPLVRRRTTP